MKLKVWGDYGLFSMPYSKPESISYPVPTWTALEGMIRSIYWKPEFSIKIRKVDILNNIQWQTFMVNGVNTLPGRKLYTDIRSSRTQMRQRCLRDIAYIIYFDVADADDKKKHESIFYRRLSQGKCKKSLYLGITDFKAYFGMVDGTEEPCQSVNGTYVLPKSVHYCPNKKGKFSITFGDSKAPVNCDKMYDFGHFEVKEGVMLCTDP